MNRIHIIFLIVIIFLSTMKADPVNLPIEEIIVESELVFIGEMVRIDSTKTEFGVNKGYLRIDYVLFDELIGSNATGKEIPLIMPFEKNKIGYFEIGTRGIWILKLENNIFQITYPDEFQPVEEDSKIIQMIKKLKPRRNKFRVDKHHKNTRTNTVPIEYRKTKTFDERASSFDFYGGISMPINTDSDGQEIGYNFGITGVAAVTDDFSIGGSYTYNKWTLDTNISDFTVTMKYTEFLAVLRYITDVKKGYFTYFQLGGGIFSGTGESNLYSDSYMSTNSDFGVSLSFGIVFDHFLIIPSYKHVFVEDYEHPKWISVSIGLTL